MQGARPFFWFHGFKGSFTPRISRCARFIAEPRINLRSRRRLCLLLFIFLPILPSLPLLFPLPPFLLLLLLLQARSLDEISAFGYVVVVVVAEDASRIGSSFRSFIVRILATISSSLSFL